MDKTTELQLFKLFHNEKDIDELVEEISRKNQHMDKEKRKRDKVEDEIKDKKKDHGKLSRELNKIDQGIKEAVGLSLLFII